MSSLINVTLNKLNTQPLDTSRNVKPDKPKGYLVNTPIYRAPFEYVGDLAADTYDVVKGFQGKANDHELGKQNDLAMKLGSLAIAGYLMSFRPSNITRLMEVVGVGSFFTSMALWPKLAIALPLKLRTGVDIQQKYVDSYNRKKNFFQDPQYLPWDLYSKKQIDEIGRKMGVPYDVPNRDEVIKEKARKMAVQGNTLWMATAGFATPIATGLICSGLEPVVENLRQKFALKNSQKIMNGEGLFNSTSAAPKSVQKQLESFLTENMGSKITSYEKLLPILNWGEAKHVYPLLEEGLVEDLNNLMRAQNPITKEFTDGLYERFGEPLSKAGISKSNLESAFEKGNLFGNQDEFLTRYKKLLSASETVTRVASSTIDTPVVVKEATSIPLAVKDFLEKLIDKNTTDGFANELKEQISLDGITSYLNDSYNKKPLDENTAKELRKFFDEISNFYNRDFKLLKWEDARISNFEDAMRAHSWKRFSKELFLAMGFTTKEIEQMSLEGSKTMKIFNQKVEEIVKDPQKYKKVVKRLAGKIAEFDAVTGESAREQYRNYVDRLCDATQSKLKEMGFTSTAEKIGGREFLRDAEGNILNAKDVFKGSVRNLKKITFDHDVLNERSTFYRILQIFDFNKRAYDGTLEGQYNLFEKEYLSLPNFNTVEKTARKAITKYGPAAHEVKLNSGIQKLGANGYKTVMRLLYGLLPKRYINDMAQSLCVDSADQNGARKAFAAFSEAYNKGEIERAFKVLDDLGFDKVRINKLRTGLHQDTIEALYESGKTSGIDLVDNLKVYMQTFVENVINDKKEGALKNCHLDGTDLTGSMKGLAGPDSPILKKALIGAFPDDVVRNGASNIAKRSKWLRKFGIGGAILLAGTVLTTMFFGYIPKSEMYMTNGKKTK